MYRNNRIGNVSPFVKKLFGGTVLGIVLCGTSFFVVRDYQEQKSYQAWARTKNQELYNQSLTRRTEERLSLKESQKKNDSFYQRLHDHLPVRILVLGDAYGHGLGAEKKKSTWFSILENSLRKKYKVNVTIDNMSLSGSTTAYSGFGLLSSMDNQSEGGKDYDLCILSFGTNDKPKDFSLWYEGILRNLQEKYPHCSVMSILGHQGVMQPESGYLDENANALKNLTKTYDGALIDMPSAMSPKDRDNSEDKGSQYTNDGLFLNDSGQKLLADTIFHSIVSTVSKYPDYKKDAVTPVSPEAPALMDPVYIPSDNFTRIDQYTLTIGPAALKEAGIDTEHFIGTLGVDFSYIPGANDLLVSDGGRGLGRNAFSLTDTKEERAIEPINDHVKISDYLMLSFLTKSQADTFRGVLFTKDVPMSETLDAFTSPEIIGPVDGTGTLIPLDREGKKITETDTETSAPVTGTSASKPASSKASAAKKESENAVNETLVNSRPAEAHSEEITSEKATENSRESAYSEPESDEVVTHTQDQPSEKSGETNHANDTTNNTDNGNETSETGVTNSSVSESASSDVSEDSFPTLPDDANQTSLTKPDIVKGDHLMTTSSPKVKTY
ncbi:GDSL-type esterase/lipase family protein [Oribacterium sp. P6A1]|uniref:GDSL-type esterase/lipase family protein n=1 Tax=Oribacterium sp. P6A1 TaxID=1410612 RepID=UPI000568D7C8|nr:GDSL-type esterase/lipase family protein [Oribacterium sp. P6A1]